MTAERAWLFFAAGTAAGLAGLALLTHVTLRRARATEEAAVAAQLAEDQRAALARMDLLFGSSLARATARVEGALVETGRAVQAFRIELPAGHAVPDPAGAPAPAALVRRADAAWSDADRPPLPVASPVPLGAGLDPWTQRGEPRSNQEYLARYGVNAVQNSGVLPVPSQGLPARTPLLVGALVAAWEEGASGRELAFGRRIELEGVASHQVFRARWPALAELLLSTARDLVPGARLEPVEPEAGPSGDRLATLPARLVVPPRTVATRPDAVLRATLAGAWVLALVAAGGAAWALRASLSDAARQRRFATAVTHELRTPLTTLRLYGEMLAKGMVPAGSEGEYLAALEAEAVRLGTLVENVLAQARLERGGARFHPERIAAEELVERHRERLERRLLQAGTRLEVDLGDAARAAVRADVDAVGLVLSNLVDNACKYGAPGGGHRADAPVRLSARADARDVVLVLEDAGSGVPPHLAAAVFRPFDRAGRDESDASPGVGLGLALARDVARALGGDLGLEPPAGRGARFALRLPRAS